eukprot:TRINITY_DN17602_c0_g1_i1.p1 TRINITY_DN17602_c0_g1~~TRINITY_DN17602_c0_g1_i1.p1  ORF type:complete len:485 (+),score=92.18 TRINITY_DN17602_c0_g1_i1:101-1456(+)
MESAAEWTGEEEEALAAVVATVLTAGCNAEAQPLWRFLQRGGRVPAGRVPPHAFAGPPLYEVTAFAEEGSDGVRCAPDLAGAPPLQSASLAGPYLTALTAHGGVLCSQRSSEGLSTVPLPWPVAAVGCGLIGPVDAGYDAVAYRRGGGALCRWRRCTSDAGHGGSHPEEVRGMPPGDPVIALEAGGGVTVPGWGPHGHIAPSGGAAVLSGQRSWRRVRRWACSQKAVAIETEEGELLCLGLHANMSSPAAMRLPDAAAVTFPLRDMVTVQLGWLYFVDATGAVWWTQMDSRLCEPLRFPLQVQQQRVVRVAFAAQWDPHPDVSRLVALTDRGELWCYYHAESAQAVTSGWTSISAAHPAGGAVASRVVLLHDLSCGRTRLQLFARIAARLGLPADVVRTALLRTTVQSCYIVGDDDEPFCWPLVRAPGAASAAVVVFAAAAASAAAAAAEH